MQQESFIKDINNIVKDLMMEDPFYGLFISSVRKEANNKIPLAAVSLNKSTMDFKLLINPEEWEKYDWWKKKGIVKHEAKHIIFMHMISFGFMTNHKMANVAMDIEINQTVGKDNLPEWACFIEDFKIKYPQLNWKENAGSIHYYNELNKLSEEEKQGLGISDKAQHRWAIIGDDGKPARLTDAERESVRIEVENKIKKIADEVEKSGGNLSAEINELIKGFIKPKAKINYRQYIRQFIANSDRYKIKFSKFKENQKFEGQPKTILKPENKIVVYIDQSGSVDEKTLHEFMNEIFHLKKFNNVTIFPFDTQVMREIRIKGDSSERRACGGTEPICCIEHYEKSNYTTAIIYTDGHFGAIRTTNKNLLWVIDPTGTMESTSNQQYKIKLPND